MNTHSRSPGEKIRRAETNARRLLAVVALSALTAGMSGCASTRYVSAPSDAADAAKCDACAGKGQVAVRCLACGGQGYMTVSTPGLYGPTSATVPCHACLKAESLGTSKFTVCPRCQGTGRVYRVDSSGNRLPAASAR